MRQVYHMENPAATKLLPAFGILVALLLIGARLQFGWAGGDGYKPQEPAGILAIVGTPDIDREGSHRAAVQTGSLLRGETIRTGFGERVKLQCNFGYQVWLDENTDLAVVENTKDRVVLRLIRGRIYADTQEFTDIPEGLTVQTNDVRATVKTGKLHVVNYDFLETVSIAPIETTASVSVHGGLPFFSPTALSIHETDPVSVTQSDFNMAAAPAFMEWITQ